VEHAEVEGLAGFLFRTLTQLADFQLADLVGQGLAWPGDVAVDLVITPAAKKVTYQPEARARDPVRFPRWRVGLICSSMRNFLAGVISISKRGSEVFCSMESMAWARLQPVWCRPVSTTNRAQHRAS